MFIPDRNPNLDFFYPSRIRNTVMLCVWKAGLRQRKDVQAFPQAVFCPGLRPGTRQGISLKITNQNKTHCGTAVCSRRTLDMVRGLFVILALSSHNLLSVVANLELEFGAESRSIPLTNGSGSGRPKSMRIRIPNTG
jgi:hypothetical protein